MTTQDERDRLQRALNEAKKRELEQRYGGSFRGSSTLPPEVEADWLAHIEEFERQFEAAGQTTVRNYCGNPVFKPLAHIPPEELAGELERVLDFLSDHNIEVHFGSLVTDEDAYRFVTEELPEEELDDIRIEGMTQNFLYEEFHPDDRSDASMYAEIFVRQLFIHQQLDIVIAHCADGEIYRADGTPGTLASMQQQIDDFRRGIAAFVEFDVKAVRCQAVGEYATVELEMRWQGLRTGSMETVAGAGSALIRLKKNDGSDWLVVQAQLPGESRDAAAG